MVSVYFVFTSLSTVGFGDYYPKSDMERLGCAMILFGGVIIFSYIMNCFNELLDSFRLLMSDLEDEDGLSKFFSVIDDFNGKTPIDQEVKEEI